MPQISPADHTILQSGPPTVDYYLAIMPRRVIFACNLDNASATWGLRELQYDGVSIGFWQDVLTGAWGSVANASGQDLGQTMLVYSSANVYKGRVRVRAVTASTITVAANNDIEWADDDQLRVLDHFEPWARPTYMVDAGGGAGITYYKDTDITWTSNNVSFPPKANGTVAWAGDVGINVQFDAAASHPTAPGATIASYQWFVKDGAFVVGNANMAAITIRFDHAGFRWILLVVTDSNGQKNVHRLPAWSFGGNYQPFTDFSISRRGSDGRDTTLQIEGFGSELTPDDPLNNSTEGIAENIGVLLFTRTYIQGVERPLDSACPFPGRGHIKFVGWILRESVRWDPETGEVSFSAAMLGKMADDVPGYPTFVKDSGSPDVWQTVSNCTVRRAIFWLWHWHTNLDTLAHMEILSTAAADPTDPIAGRNFPKNPPFKQVENAFLQNKGIFAKLGITRWGSVHVRYDPQILSDADRLTRPIVMDLTNEDWTTELTIEKSHRPALSAILGGGIYYDGSDGTPYRGRSPGQVGRESGQERRADNLIITGQADLNAKLGRLLAAESSPWRPLSIENYYDIWEPALQEYVTLTVTADENPRGHAFDTGTRWILRRVDIDDASGDTPTVRLTVEQLMTGFAGVTVPIPDPPSYPAPEYPPELPDIEPEVDYGTGERVGVVGNGGFYYSLDALSGSPPTWTKNIGGDPTTDGITHGESVCNDPAEPWLAAMLCDNGTVYVNTNWPGGAAWSSALTTAQATAMIEAATGEAIVTIEIVDVKSFVTGQVLAVVNFSTLNYDDTRVIRSDGGWGGGWVLGGRCVGNTFMGTKHYRWVYVRCRDGDGIGELAHDGVYLYMCGKSFPGWADAAMNYSSDEGDSWADPATIGCRNDDFGPRTAAAMTTGTLLMSRWCDPVSGNLWVASTADQGTTISMAKLLANHDGFAELRGTMRVLCDDSWVMLQVDWPGGDPDDETEVWVNGVKTATLSEPFRTVHGFELDETVMYLLRSYGTGEEAVVAYPTVFMVSQNKGLGWSDKSGSLRTLGLNFGTGIITDWSAD